MRRILLRQRWISGIVAGLLLFATSGAALSRMTCLMGGHSVLSVGLVQDCCPDEHPDQEAALRPTCCDLTQARLDQPDLLQAKSLSLDLSPAFVVGLVVPLGTVETAIRPEWIESRPPPMDVPERLAHLRTRLI